MSNYQHQEIQWLEPFSYAWSSGRTSIRTVCLIASVLWLLIMCLIAAFISLKTIHVQTSIIVAFIIALACFLVTWLVSRLPKNVLVYQKGIFIGKMLIPTARIKSASVESVVLNDKSYSVLQFCTTKGRIYKIALSNSIDSTNLAKFLELSGIGKLS